MPREEIHEEIASLVEPASMTSATIVEELGDRHSKREVKLAILDMRDEGRLEEHPEIDDAYRVADG